VAVAHPLPVWQAVSLRLSRQDKLLCKEVVMMRMIGRLEKEVLVLTMKFMIDA